jgi:hypothetical protein
VFKSANEVSEYHIKINTTTSLANGAYFTKSAPALLVKTFTASSSSTRTTNSLAYNLTCNTASSAADRIFVHFHPHWYSNIMITATTKMDSYVTSSMTPTVESYSYKFTTGGTYSFVTNAYQTITVNSLSTPYEDGLAYFPMLDFVAWGTAAVQCTMYLNLLKFSPFNFTHPGT